MLPDFLARVPTIVLVFAFTPSPPKQPFDYKALTGEGKETFSLHLPSPTPHFGEGSEGKKHDLLCSIHARENKQKEATHAPPHPTQEARLFYLPAKSNYLRGRKNYL